MIKINLLPDEKRKKISTVSGFSGSKLKNLNWFVWGPAIAGGILVLAFAITFFILYMPNSSKAQELANLQAEWKKLEPDYNFYNEKEKEYKKQKEILDELYAFIDDKVIWSRILYIIAKNIPPEIQLIRLIGRDEKKKVDVVQKVEQKDDKGNVKIVKKIVTKEKPVHTVKMDGLVPIDGQAKVIMFKKNLEKDEFLKKVLIESKIPGITATSRKYKSFTMYLIFNSVKAERE